MSGGSLEYVFSRIDCAADDIEAKMREWDDWDEKKECFPLFRLHDSYIKEHPDKQWLANPKLLKKETFKRLREAVRTMRLAAIMAQRAEWLMSGDDGFESFCLGMDEEIAEFKAKEKAKKKEVL